MTTFETDRKLILDNYVKSYRAVWVNMFDRLDKSGSDVFCPQSACGYIFKTGGMLWGMDINFRDESIFETVADRFYDDLNTLKYVFLTHEHDDHYDKKLISNLAGSGITWIIPDFMAAQTDYIENKIYIKSGETLKLGTIEATAFTSLHYRANGGSGVDEYGYLIDTGRKKLLFPCDIRNYNAELPQYLQGADILFSHLWLGDNNALDSEFEPYISDYCRFTSSLKAKRIVISHLYETGRQMNAMWTIRHAEPAIKRLHELNSETEVTALKVGDIYKI